MITKEFKEAVEKLPNNIKYIVVEDCQGGDFGMYRYYGMRDWVKQAIEWLDEDEIECDPIWLLEDNRLDRMSDFWEIRFAKLDTILDAYNSEALERDEIITRKMLNEADNYYELYDRLIEFWNE